MPGDQQRGRSIEENGVAIGARLSGEQAAKRFGIVPRVATTNGGDGMTGKPGILGGDGAGGRSRGRPRR